jgi:hypothetical protein
MNFEDCKEWYKNVLTMLQIKTMILFGFYFNFDGLARNIVYFPVCDQQEKFHGSGFDVLIKSS